MYSIYFRSLIFVGFFYFVNTNNPYLISSNYYNRPSAIYFHPQENYHLSQSKKIQSYVMPKWPSNHYRKRTVNQPQNYLIRTYQNSNVNQWPLMSPFYGDHNHQVQSESYNRPIYRKQNYIKKSSNTYNQKIDFTESKKKKIQPVCKASGETCYGWEPYIPENCCKGYVCDHTTKSIVGTCVKKIIKKPMTSKQSNIVQRPLTTEELLAGVA